MNSEYIPYILWGIALSGILSSWAILAIAAVNGNPYHTVLGHDPVGPQQSGHFMISSTRISNTLP